MKRIMILMFGISIGCSGAETSEPVICDDTPVYIINSNDSYCELFEIKRFNTGPFSNFVDGSGGWYPIGHDYGAAIFARCIKAKQIDRVTERLAP